MDLQRLNCAIEAATIAHQNQFRKGTETPYITHPFAVGMLLTQAGCSDDVVIAGLLHDVVEDTSLTLQDIRQRFGEHVAELVAGCSEPDKSLSWRERKQHTIDYLESASEEVKLVACADKLHNIISMLGDYEVYGETLWNRFNEGPYEQEWYYSRLADALKYGLFFPHPLGKLFADAVDKLFTERKAQNRKIADASLCVGDDIEDQYYQWSSVWEPDTSNEFFKNFLIPHDGADCENMDNCDDYDEEEGCACSVVDLEAVIDHLRELAPHILWKIDTNGYDDCTEGFWQWSTISVPDDHMPEAESIIQQIEKNEEISAYDQTVVNLKQIEDFYPYLYDDKKRLRQEISNLFMGVVDLRRFVYGGYESYLSNGDDYDEAPIRHLIKLLGNLFSAGKGIAEIELGSCDLPETPDDYYKDPFSETMWTKYGCHAKKFLTAPESDNPFKLVVKINQDLSHVLDYFKGKGPKKIAEAVNCWQFEFSCTSGSGDYIRTVLMHMHDIVEEMTKCRLTLRT